MVPRTVALHCAYTARTSRAAAELLGGGALPAALARLWTTVVAADRTRKAKFLAALLKPFEEASCLAVQGGPPPSPCIGKPLPAATLPALEKA